jgi:outer membrane protein assembly factor BamD
MIRKIIRRQYPTLERFTKLYPNNESTPYAYYIIALCYYEQISDVGRDQKITEQSMQALREVIRRFPDSEYARDARIKLDLTQDHLAGKEMEIGRYYLRHDDYIAAINRFRFVVENYQTTSHVPEALHRLVECYLKLGVKDEATRYAAVLGNNFPGSVWYRDSYKLMTGDLQKAGKPTKVASTGNQSPSSNNPAPAVNTDENNKPAWWDSIIH